MKFLRAFGLGLLTMLLLPLILAGVALVAVFGLLNYFVQLIKTLVRFFRGEKLFEPFKEDNEAYEILLKKYQSSQNEKEAPAQLAQQPVYVQQNYYSAPNPYMNPYGVPMQQPNQIPQQPAMGPQQQLPQQPYQQPQQIPNPELRELPSDNGLSSARFNFEEGGHDHD